MAVGAGGRLPVMPEYPNRVRNKFGPKPAGSDSRSFQEIFGGEVLHSAHYTNPTAWRGKHGVIVGTANTGKQLLFISVA
jgi:hypothetical protein